MAKTAKKKIAIGIGVVLLVLGIGIFVAFNKTSECKAFEVTNKKLGFESSFTQIKERYSDCNSAIESSTGYGSSYTALYSTDKSYPEVVDEVKNKLLVANIKDGSIKESTDSHLGSGVAPEIPGSDLEERKKNKLTYTTFNMTHIDPTDPDSPRLTIEVFKTSDLTYIDVTSE